MVLALTLSAYALSVTIGHGRFSDGSVALLSIALLGVGAFAYAETRVESPLIRLEMFRDSSRWGEREEGIHELQSSERGP